MKLPILIVRTVSVEKLSSVFDSCAMRWPRHPVLVVTSPTRYDELRADSRISEIVLYATRTTGFSEPIACDRELEAVIVPVANRGGTGYANVMRACQNLNTRSWFLASSCRDFTELTRGAWARRWRLIWR